jgi:hypothetical protein
MTLRRIESHSCPNFRYVHADVTSKRWQERDHTTLNRYFTEGLPSGSPLDSGQSGVRKHDFFSAIR